MNKLKRNFFFQAEDGIRDFHVTGVQTCALPICQPHDGLRGAPAELDLRLHAVHVLPAGSAGRGRGDRDLRSEERRVGKECRCRRGMYHETEKVKILLRLSRRSWRTISYLSTHDV